MDLFVCLSLPVVNVATIDVSAVDDDDGDFCFVRYIVFILGIYICQVVVDGWMVNVIKIIVMETRKKYVSMEAIRETRY